MPTQARIRVADGTLLDSETLRSHGYRSSRRDVDSNIYDESFTITLNDLAESNNAPTDLSSGIELNTDGGNDAYLYTATGGAILGGLDQMTVEVVFSLDATSTGQIALLSYATTSFDDEVQIVLRPDGRLEIEVQDVPAVTTDSLPELFDGQQHHIAASWDATNGVVQLYVDGQLVETFTGIAQGVSLTTRRHLGARAGTRLGRCQLRIGPGISWHLL